MAKKTKRKARRAAPLMTPTAYREAMIKLHLSSRAEESRVLGVTIRQISRFKSEGVFSPSIINLIEAELRKVSLVRKVVALKQELRA